MARDHAPSPGPVITDSSAADGIWVLLTDGRTEAASERAEQLVAETRDHGPDERAAALAVLAGARRQQHRDDEAADLAGQALALSDEPVVRARALNALAEVQLQRGFYVRGRELLEGGLRPLGEGEHTLTERARLQNNLGRACFELCDYPAAQQAFRDAYALFERSGMGRGMATTAMNAGNVRSQLGDYGGALDAYRLAQRHCQDGPAFLQAVVQFNLACVYETLGELETAAELCRDALELDLAEDLNAIRPFLVALLGRIMRRQGRFDEARSAMEQALVVHRAAGDRGHEASLLAEMGDLLLDEGRPEAARESYAQGLSTLGELIVPVAETACRFGLARVRRALGEHDEALQLLDDLLAHPGEVPDRRTRVELLRERGDVLAGLGREGPARRDAEEADRLALPGVQDPRLERLMMLHRLERARAREQRLSHRVDEQGEALVRAELRRGELEEGLRRARRMEAIGRLAGGVAHDFNNLLTIVMQHADRLVELLPDDGAAREEALGVLSASRRASELTASLLAFSREQARTPSRLDLSAAVTALRPALERLAGDGVELLFHSDPHAGTVLADRIQLDRVLLNLVANGRDAMPAGGRLTVATGARTLPAEVGGLVDELLPGDYVSLTVSDTGQGIPRSLHGRIFEPFFTTKGAGRGTGLGLPTVWGIARQSGGGVAVRSEPGRGCTIEVLLPRVEGPADEAPGLEPPPPALEASSEVARVLLVEDEEGLRRLLVRGLRRHGIDVLEAADGVDAVETLRAATQAVHVVVSDVVMPRLGGPEMLTRLRALQPGLHCVFTSGYPDPGQLADEADVTFLPKPFGIADLAQLVRSLVARGR